MKWTYDIGEKATRDLRKLGPSAKAKVVAFLEKRIHGTADPRAFGKPLGGNLHGLWRYRIEDYRVLCRLEDHRLVVLVVAVGHRSDVYD